MFSVNHPKPTKGLDGLTGCNWCGDPSRGKTSFQCSSRMNLLALPFSDITQCGRSWQGTNRSEQGALFGDTAERRPIVVCRCLSDHQGQGEDTMLDCAMCHQHLLNQTAE